MHSGVLKTAFKRFSSSNMEDADSVGIHRSGLDPYSRRRAMSELKMEERNCAKGPMLL